MSAARTAEVHGGLTSCTIRSYLQFRAPTPSFAGTRALQDAGIPYSSVQQAVVGYVYGESTCGQRALYQLGLTGIPIYNVRGVCACVCVCVCNCVCVCVCVCV